jgi:hypothetical protein
MTKTLITLFMGGAILIFSTATGKDNKNVRWKHLSSTKGDIERPNAGKQQTSSAVFDVDSDGDNDFMITERTEAPSIVWYRRGAKGWDRYIVDSEHLRIEAGSAVHDIDGDGDLDVVFGGDGSSNLVWWWENPSPVYDPSVPWKRREIKNSGNNKHHDQMFGDFDNDGETELVFWNQGGHKLCLVEIPDNPRNAATWHSRDIYLWSNDSQMAQRGSYPGWKSVNEHEGFDTADIDGDGLLDIVGGGRWFKYMGDGKFTANIVDAGYSFTRSAAGQLIEGGRPEIVLVVGDGLAPLIIYQWKDGTWEPTVLVDSVNNGHSIDLIDFNGDGHLDIFNAEMNLGDNPKAKTRILLGDGNGNFESITVIEDYANHESRIADLDGDGDYDILGKPYKWEAPRIDIWINEGK